MRKKSERTGKLHTSIRRAKVCLYQEKMTFLFSKEQRGAYI